VFVRNLKDEKAILELCFDSDVVNMKFIGDKEKVLLIVSTRCGKFTVVDTTVKI